METKYYKKAIIASIFVFTLLLCCINIYVMAKRHFAVPEEVIYTGNIYKGMTGEALEGAKITVEGYNIALTNKNGEFGLIVPKEAFREKARIIYEKEGYDYCPPDELNYPPPQRGRMEATVWLYPKKSD